MNGLGISLAEGGLLPDALIRLGIRRLLKARLELESRRHAGGDMESWITGLEKGPLALVPHKANQQHYEVPPEFFRAMLGPNLKYSSCIYPQGNESLDQAEQAMLALTAERAGITDGMRVLELGCGWGSLSLWMARHFPGARITGLSNSAAQRGEILARARERGLENLEILTADINDFRCDRRFDRVVSVEMFEHMYNIPELLRRVAGWLEPEGRLFLHVFCHRQYSYPFAERNGSDWMARHFFSGGMMPAETLYERFDSHLQVERRWMVAGSHYARTSRQWLETLDHNRRAALVALGAETDKEGAARRVQRWRMFLMACEELFGHDGGREWFVSHQLLRPRGERP
jgi:cyclopropane-fatty-acyl-phospholipid synthase